MLAAFSILPSDNPFTMLLTIGKTIVITQPKITNREVSDNVAQIQSGICFPLMEIFCNPFIIGLANNETTTEVRIYTSTLLKYQQIAAIRQNIAVNRVYFASLSVYFSVFIRKNFCLCYSLAQGGYTFASTNKNNN